MHRLSDDELEQQIAAAQADMTRAATSEAMRLCWQKLASLVAMRSPEQVRRMEQARGLDAGR